MQGPEKFNNSITVDTRLKIFLLGKLDKISISLPLGKVGRSGHSTVID